jgi:hypothetical protein
MCAAISAVVIYMERSLSSQLPRVLTGKLPRSALSSICGARGQGRHGKYWGATHRWSSSTSTPRRLRVSTVLDRVHPKYVNALKCASAKMRVVRVCLCVLHVSLLVHRRF